MAVLARALLRRMGMVVKLRVGHGVVNVALRVVVPFVKGFDVLDQLSDDVVTGDVQDTEAFHDLLARLAHILQAFQGQRLETVFYVVLNHDPTF